MPTRFPCIWDKIGRRLQVLDDSVGMRELLMQKMCEQLTFHGGARNIRSSYPVESPFQHVDMGGRIYPKPQRRAQRRLSNLTILDRGSRLPKYNPSKSRSHFLGLFCSDHRGFGTILASAVVAVRTSPCSTLCGVLLGLETSAFSNVLYPQVSYPSNRSIQRPVMHSTVEGWLLL